LKAHDFSIAVLGKWILSVCLNIRTLTLPNISQSFCNELARLKKLKKLKVWADNARALKLVTLKLVTLIALGIMTTLLTFS
jgi:hypothetical protein